MKPLKVGQLAKRTGLSVRTLHYYDEIDLTRPSQRSRTGHRLYDEGDIARLRQIKALRQLGLSLEEIRDCLRSEERFAPLDAIERHLKHARAQYTLFRRLADRLDALARTMREGRNVSAPDFLKAVEVMTMEAITMIDKIYTKTGDDGTTGLLNGARVKKASARIEACGCVDELNTSIGAARATALEIEADDVLAQVQIDLFSLGTELALPSGTMTSFATTVLGTQDIRRLERAIDSTEAQLSPLKHLLVPGGCVQAVALHQGRVICRRTERALLGLDDLPPRSEVVAYLNRLGDLLFVLARRANAAAGVQDIPWRPSLQAMPGTES